MAKLAPFNLLTNAKQTPKPQAAQNAAPVKIQGDVKRPTKGGGFKRFIGGK